MEQPEEISMSAESIQEEKPATVTYYCVHIVTKGPRNGQMCHKHALHDGTPYLLPHERPCPSFKAMFCKKHYLFYQRTMAARQDAWDRTRKVLEEQKNKCKLPNKEQPTLNEEYKVRQPVKMEKKGKDSMLVEKEPIRIVIPLVHELATGELYFKEGLGQPLMMSDVDAMKVDDLVNCIFK